MSGSWVRDQFLSVCLPCYCLFRENEAFRLQLVFLIIVFACICELLSSGKGLKNKNFRRVFICFSLKIHTLFIYQNNQQFQQNRLDTLVQFAKNNHGFLGFVIEGHLRLRYTISRLVSE